MAKREDGSVSNGRKDNAGDQVALTEPRSLGISRQGIKTGEDFANLMSNLMSDILEGRVTPSIANATVNAGGKLLKVVEMQYRYSPPQPTGATARPGLILAPGESTVYEEPSEVM